MRNPLEEVSSKTQIPMAWQLPLVGFPPSCGDDACEAENQKDSETMTNRHRVSDASTVDTQLSLIRGTSSSLTDVPFTDNPDPFLMSLFSPMGEENSGHPIGS